MAWFSYFLLSVPEVIFMVTVAFALLGIAIKEKLKSILIFAFIYGAFAFSLSMFFEVAFKPFITFTIFSLLLALIFRFKLHHAFLIGLISFVFLSIYEITFVLLYIELFSISYEQILTTPWLRIALGILAVHVPLLITTLILLKFNLKFKIPSLK